MAGDRIAADGPTGELADRFRRFSYVLYVLGTVIILFGRIQGVLGAGGKAAG